jgi:hypothetical protein
MQTDATTTPPPPLPPWNNRDLVHASLKVWMYDQAAVLLAQAYEERLCHVQVRRKMTLKAQKLYAPMGGKVGVQRPKHTWQGESILYNNTTPSAPRPARSHIQLYTNN